MFLHAQGIVRGNRIEFDRDIGIPDGTEVTVHLEPTELPIEEKRRIVAESCGAWDDDSLDSIFAEIIANRSKSKPRDIDLDVSS